MNAVMEMALRGIGNREKKAILLMLILFLACCGCSSQTPPPLEEDDVQAIEERTVSVAPLLTWENPDSENLADMLQRECGGMMVQLSTGGSKGSGVIYSVEEGAMVILTAAHVLTNADSRVKITFVDGWETESADFFLWEQADVAQIRLPLEQIPEEGLEKYRLANVDREAYDKLQAGDGCIVMGSKTGVAEEAYEGTVLDAWIYMEDYGHHMVWVKAYGKPGMSGGGLFDQQGHFLGILSGISEDEEWAAVPLVILLEGP